MKSMMSLVAALSVFSTRNGDGLPPRRRPPDDDPLLLPEQSAPYAGGYRPGENGKLVFNFVDATNMSSPDAMHMHKLVVTFVDEDHFVQKWTWKGGEKEGTEVFRMERMK